MLITRADSCWVNAWIISVMATFTTAIVHLRRCHELKVLDQHENQTPVKKCIKYELTSLSCLKNLERFSFLICYQKKICYMVEGIILLYFVKYIKILTNLLQLSERKKINREDLRGHGIVLAIVKHPILLRYSPVC